MADKKITDLPAAITIDGTEALEAVQSTTSKQVYISQIRNYVLAEAEGYDGARFKGILGENGTAGEVFYIDTVSGEYFKADSTDENKIIIAGVLQASAGIGTEGNFVFIGDVTGLSGLTAGSKYYLGTSGALTTTVPSGARSIYIGLATGTDSLQVNVELFPPSERYSLVDISAANQTVTLPTPTGSGDEYTLEAYGGDGTYTATFAGQTLYKKNTVDTGTLSGEGKITVKDINSRWQIIDFHCVFQTGWNVNSDWTNATLSATHNMDAPLRSLSVKVLFSQTGVDGDSELWDDTSIVRSSVDVFRGYKTAYVSNNQINIRTADSGLLRIIEPTGGSAAIDTETWYYNTVITRSF